jgi:SAM-dependent methyltransferase
MNPTKPDAAVLVEAVLPQAPATQTRLERGGTILAVGWGAGDAVAHYARRFPRSLVVGLEGDGASVDLARRTAAGEGVAARIEIRHGAANELEEWGVYDLVTLVISPHEPDGSEEYRDVLERVRRALRPGGTAIVAGLAASGAGPADRASPRRRPAGVKQLRRLLTDVGFVNVRFAAQFLPNRFVMLAERGRG